MPKCSTEYVLLEAPLTLAELARHLATRKNFLFHPCGNSVVRALEVVARPYGYTVTFDAEGEVACLLHSSTAQHCDCDGAFSHLSARQQLKLLLRQ